jgi:hypothetical protein
MGEQTRVLVTGAGGFIGSHLVTFLKEKGYWVRGVDLKYPEFWETDADEFEILDLRRWDNCLQATRNVDEVYALAADMARPASIPNICRKTRTSRRLRKKTLTRRSRRTPTVGKNSFRKSSAIITATITGSKRGPSAFTISSARREPGKAAAKKRRRRCVARSRPRN